MRIWEKRVKKISVFELRYLKMNLWKNSTEFCDWYDDCHKFYNFKKNIKYTFTNS